MYGEVWQSSFTAVKKKICLSTLCPPLLSSALCIAYFQEKFTPPAAFWFAFQTLSLLSQVLKCSDTHTHSHTHIRFHCYFVLNYFFLAFPCLYLRLPSFCIYPLSMKAINLRVWAQVILLLVCGFLCDFYGSTLKCVVKCILMHSQIFVYEYLFKAPLKIYQWDQWELSFLFFLIFYARRTNSSYYYIMLYSIEYIWFYVSGKSTAVIKVL